MSEDNETIHPLEQAARWFDEYESHHIHTAITAAEDEFPVVAEAAKVKAELNRARAAWCRREAKAQTLPRVTVTNNEQVLQQTIEHDVREFHEAFGLTIVDRPTWPSDVNLELRAHLIAEEVEEFAEALDQRDINAVADALVDIVYVAVGACVTFGIPFTRLWDALHQNNMSKLGPDGKPIINGVTPGYREGESAFGYESADEPGFRLDLPTGKVLKPDGYVPFDDELERIMKEAGDAD